jgi:PLP dependent protein
VETHELQSRIAAVQERIAAAARRAGRDPAEVTLVAVSKTHAPEEVAAAYAAGLRVFGENRVEEAAPKVAAVAALLDRPSSVVNGPSSSVEWHMVGHLQSRKAEDALPWASMVHSVDTVKLAQRLSRFVTAEKLPILLEVNVAGEASKYGFHPEDLPAAVETITALPGLALQGLMTVAPIAADPEEVRPVFAALRALRDELTRSYPTLDWRHLSMGMTDDFEVAIEEGATIVRVGRAIFGDRT